MIDILQYAFHKIDIFFVSHSYNILIILISKISEYSIVPFHDRFNIIVHLRYYRAMSPARRTSDNLEKSLLSIEDDGSYWQMCYVSVFDFTRKLSAVVVGDVASR